MKNESGQAQLKFALLLVVVALAIFCVALWRGFEGAVNVEKEKTEQAREETKQERERTHQITAEYRGLVLLTTAQTAQTGAYLAMMFPYLIWGTVVIAGVVVGLFVAMRMPLRKEGSVIHTHFPSPNTDSTFKYRASAGEEKQC